MPSVSPKTFRGCFVNINFTSLNFLLMPISVAAQINACVLSPLICWDCGFESRRGHGCLSRVSVVCCRVEVSASESYLVWCV
jgi:hypothetical protein